MKRKEKENDSDDGWRLKEPLAPGKNETLSIHTSSA